MRALATYALCKPGGSFLSLSLSLCCTSLVAFVRPSRLRWQQQQQMAGVEEGKAGSTAARP